MDATLLTKEEFWVARVPVVFSKLPAALPVDDRLQGCVIFETSGSSGIPKWVVISKVALLASAKAVNQHLEVKADSCWGLALPVHHVGGFGVAARAYVAGSRLAVLDGKWQPAAFVDWIASERVTHASLVPTQVHDLVKANRPAPANLRAIVVGGGHLDEMTGRAARGLGWPVLASYGMTETSSQIATQSLESLSIPYQPTPIPVLPLWQVFINDSGLLVIGGGALFEGYLFIKKSEPENIQLEYIPNASELYVSSDRAMINSGGITPLGRADFLVKVLGELVDPEMIERDLIEVSKGKISAGEFVVLAVPDQRAGHALLPIFESKVELSVIESVLSAYQKSAPGFCKLLPGAIIGELPRSDLGKILRRRIALESTDLRFL